MSDRLPNLSVFAAAVHAAAGYEASTELLALAFLVPYPTLYLPTRLPCACCTHRPRGTLPAGRSGKGERAVKRGARPAGVPLPVHVLRAL